MSDDLIKRIKEGCAGRDRWYVMNAAEDGYCMDFDWQLTADQWMAERLRENPDYIKRNGYHIVKQRSFTAAEGLANEAAALIEQQAARIAELEAQIATVAPAVDAQPVARVESWTNGSYHRNYRLTWLKDVPEGTELYASAQSERWTKDAERYSYLRRRAVMVDYSDDTVTKLTLFKEEGPTGEFLDDWVDGALSKKEPQ